MLLLPLLPPLLPEPNPLDNCDVEPLLPPWPAGKVGTAPVLCFGCHKNEMLSFKILRFFDVVKLVVFSWKKVENKKKAIQAKGGSKEWKNEQWTRLSGETASNSR